MGRNKEQETQSAEARAKAAAEQLPEDLRGIAAEYPEWAEILAGPNYDSPEPEVLDPDPQMRYYLAAPDERYPNHPGNVSNCIHRYKYRISSKQLTNRVDDCVLMEQPRALYEVRKRREQATFQRELDAIGESTSKGQPKDGLEALAHAGPDGKPPGARVLPEE